MTQQSHSQACILRKPKLKKCMYPNIHCGTIYNSWNMEASQMSMTDEWIKKLWYIRLNKYEKGKIIHNGNQLNRKEIRNKEKQ